jgi:hypothetical protein
MNPLFRINTNIGTSNYDPALMYMNNSVTIISMDLKFPADLTTQNAELKITYGKLDDKELSSRSGKGYGGNRVAKDIQIKIQRDPVTKGFLSCYAVTTNTNDRLHQEFCESLSTSGTTTEKLFTWDAATNTCKLNFSCGSSQIFTGWDSAGVKKCRNIADWMNLADLLGPSAACDLRTTKPVKLVKVGNKIQINCGGSSCTQACECPANQFCINNQCSPIPTAGTSCSTSGCYRHYTNGFFGCPSGTWVSYTGISSSCQQLSNGTPCPVSCTSACNCPNSYDACISGVCVTQTSTSCSPGVYVKGDSSCQWRCNASGTAFTCPVGATACGSSPTPCSSACDCPGSYDVCDRGTCVSRPTGCIDGEVAKGDASCKWTCNGGSWSCPVGGTACGATTTGGTSGGCFIAGTEVLMANGEKKNIEDIQVGDKLIDVDNKIVTVKTLLPRDYLGEIYSINGGPYFFTPNHPFLSLDGWKSIDPAATKKESPELKVTKLRVGDVLLKKNGIEAILSLDSKPTREKVYNFELDGSHTYLADEYWVHNKMTAPTEGCCPSTGRMVSDCGACPPLPDGAPNLCTSPSTLMCAF